ncbi:MAG TPA: sugar ABC transporter substrate-binding protein, partial [Acidobacteriota bacterium]|nr:sugar ABC transporter substrate-binding protein [Acidobacteriota bacterium]
ASCSRPSDQLRIGVAFETLQTEYWVASFAALEAELRRHNIEMIEAIADNDANRQLDQIHILIARGVDGIIVSPKDATAVIPMIRAANRANVPIVIYNRPPADGAGESVTVVADNYEIAKATVEYMAEQAVKTGRKYKAMVLVGDLGDINAIGRRDGFEDAVRPYSDTIEVVARVPTDWSQDKALAGVTNALQVNPDINFVFISSDFLFPSLISALRTAGKYKKIGEEGHVLLGGFDGDSMAYGMLVDGYLDADGVQDVYFECAASVDAVLKMLQNEEVEKIIQDPGFVIHQGNLEEKAGQMWGAQVLRSDN